MPTAEPAVASEYTGQSFDLRAYLERSEKLDLSGLDFSRVRDYPVSDAELRCLTYMMDIEAHTLCYLKDVLNADAGADPEIADFLGCWLYEEAYHGRAIEQFVRAAGVDRGADVCGQRVFTLAEKLENLATPLLSRAFGRDFLAVYMTWGAVQEHSTLFGYTMMARRTQNPILAELLRRIARDESRHFGFYYYKAHQLLSRSGGARRLTGALLKLFWTPVPTGAQKRSTSARARRAVRDAPSRRRACSK